MLYIFGVLTCCLTENSVWDRFFKKKEAVNITKPPTTNVINLVEVTVEIKHH